jgi:hypothetical protein
MVGVIEIMVLIALPPADRRESFSSSANRVGTPKE